MDARKEIDRLYDLEYGRIDAIVRFAATGLAAVMLYSYDGASEPLIWVGGICAAHLLHFSFLRHRRRAAASERDVQIAAVLFSLVVLAFLWLPSLLLTRPDPVMTIAGASGFGALLVFLIHRSDTTRFAMTFEIGAVAIAAGWIVIRTVGQVPSPGARVGVAVAATTLVAYFALTLLTNRRLRLESEAASRRSVQAQKMEAIGQLAGGVAHDFNNILTAVIGNLDLYEVLEDAGERDACIAEARTASLRAADLVRQLLSYSRRSPMTIAPCEVGALLEQVRTFTRRLLPAPIALELVAPDEPLTVAVDQNQLITALVNLVVNARDAMPKGGRLTLQAQAQRIGAPEPRADGTSFGPGDFVAIKVTDTGTGIPPEILRRVTEPFFTTKEVGQGSGLGLSMVEGFARQSGGHLRLESSSRGTCATLFLPRVAPEAPPAPPPALRLVS